jgi:micrococcal nuclease
VHSLRTVLVVCLILLSGCSAVTTPTVSNESVSGGGPVDGNMRVATVTEVVDGDTLDVRYRDGSTERVRLLGVDTPEVHTGTDPAEFEGIPESATGREWLSDWGDRASAFVRSAVGSGEVRVGTDDRADRRGSYGRLLAYVYTEDGLLNRQLLQQGYARLYESSFSKREQFRADERDARARQAGLWGGPRAATDRSTVAAGNTSLALVDIHADATGDDHQNTNDEYLVFENTGAETLSLSGWQVLDSAGHSYTAPADVAIPPGERVTLYTGTGTDSSGSLYWGRDRAVWNNDGDTIIVRTAAESVAIDRSYGAAG